MQVSVENGEGLTRRMTVGLPSDRFEAEVEKRLRDIARTVRLPGFRPGKVPVKVLRQRFGGKVQQEVFGDLVQSSFSEAVAQASLRPAGAPHIEAEIDSGEKRYGYTAVFEVLPIIEIAPIGDKTVKRPAAEVTDADLDDMIERLRTQRKTWRDVERPAQEGDRVTLSFTGTRDGEPFEGGSAENVDLELGSGRMIPGFETGLIGAVAGEERRLELAFPEEYHAEHLKGRPVVFEVRVAKVKEPVLPEVDADFARAFGIEDGDVERLRQDVRRNMERELRQRISDRIKNQVMDLLLQANPIDLPEILVKEEIKVLKEQMRQNMGGARMELPDSLFEESARRRVALGLIIAEVVKANEIRIDPARVRAAVEELASTYEDPQEVIDYYMSSGAHRKSVESLALEDQVVDWVMGQVSVEDESTSFKQLTEPMPGT
jgi:trigger factor